MWAIVGWLSFITVIGTDLSGPFKKEVCGCQRTCVGPACLEVPSHPLSPPPGVASLLTWTFLSRREGQAGASWISKAEFAPRSASQVRLSCVRKECGKEFEFDKGAMEEGNPFIPRAVLAASVFSGPEFQPFLRSMKHREKYRVGFIF